MRATAARFFGAYKKAVQSLREYYTVELPRLRGSVSRPNPLFPYKDNYSSLTSGSAIQNFKYIRPLSTTDRTKLIFYGETVWPPDSGKNLCIKFVRRYSKTAHEKCASKGYAPILHGFEELPGGWYAVVMEEISCETYSSYHHIRNAGLLSNEQHRQIRESLVACVRILHKSGLVHGDIRDSNLLVRTDGTLDIKLLDFDWAGEANVVRYPMNVNGVDIKRPEDAYDGVLITKDHDQKMVEFMFSFLEDDPMS
jgi:hypothetical protein